MLDCPTCTRPRDKRYTNEAAGEACIDPCHWPYLSAQAVCDASSALDRISPTRAVLGLHALEEHYRDRGVSERPHRAELDPWQTHPGDVDYLEPDARWCRVCLRHPSHPMHSEQLRTS